MKALSKGESGFGQYFTNPCLTTLTGSSKLRSKENALDFIRSQKTGSAYDLIGWSVTGWVGLYSCLHRPHFLLSCTGLQLHIYGVTSL